MISGECKIISNIIGSRLDHLNLQFGFFRDEHGVADHHVLVHILSSYELQHLLVIINNLVENKDCGGRVVKIIHSTLLDWDLVARKQQNDNDDH